MLKAKRLHQNKVGKKLTKKKLHWVTITKRTLGVPTQSLKWILKDYIWHLTSLYLIHPFYHNDVPNSSSGENWKWSWSMWASCRDRKKRGAIINRSIEKHNLYVLCDIERALSFGMYGKKKKKKAGRELMPTPITRLRVRPLIGQTEMFPPVTKSHHPSVKHTQSSAYRFTHYSYILTCRLRTASSWQPIEARLCCRGATQTWEPGSHWGRGMTHHPVPYPGLSCLYTSAGIR